MVTSLVATSHRNSVVILGAGSWGSALKTVLVANRVPVVVWNRSPKPDTTQDLYDVLHNDPTVILAISASCVPQMCQTIKEKKLSIKRLWIASKGLDQHTGDVLSTTIQGMFPTALLGVLAGPNIAREVVHGMPCGMTVASAHPILCQEACTWFHQSSIWAQPSQDLIGSQWWSVLKNVVAVGYGLLQQHQVGHNLSASYLAIAMQEIADFIATKGGHADTTLTFAGVGDMILTSHCPQGRNRAYGENFPAVPTTLVEGLETIKTLRQQTWFVQETSPLPLLRSIAQALLQESADDAARTVLWSMQSCVQRMSDIFQ